MQSCKKPPKLATLASSCQCFFSAGPGQQPLPTLLCSAHTFSLPCLFLTLLATYPWAWSLLCSSHLFTSLHLLLEWSFWSGSEGPWSMFSTTVVSLLSLLLCGCHLGRQLVSSCHSCPTFVPTDPKSGCPLSCCTVRMSGSTVCKPKQEQALREHTIGDQPQGSWKVQEPGPQKHKRSRAPLF